MTSRLLKSRRITAWSTAIAISLGGVAYGQSGGVPAPTTWKPYTPPTAVPTNALPPVITPASAPTASRVLPPVDAAPQSPNLPPLPELPPPPKVLQYSKPANEMKPREAAAAPVVRPRPAPPVQADPVSTPQAPLVARPAAMIRPQPSLPKPGDPLPSENSIPKSGALPNRSDLFRLDSDKTLDKRITDELTAMKKISQPEPFPVSPVLVSGTYEPKTASYAPMQLLRQPTYVIHRRLYFEQMNPERGMWDAGPAQSVFSAALFYRDVLLFPAKVASGCRAPYDSSAGKCMPGTPTPLYIYPPSDLTLFGGSVGIAVIIGTAIIFP